MNFANVCIESLCQFSLTFERVYDFFSRRKEGGRPEFFGVYMCTKHVLFERCGGKMKLQIWKQAVWQFLLNASFCRCTAG